MSDKSQHIETLLAHGGGAADPQTGGVVPAIPTATTFTRDSDYNLVSASHLYSRDDNDLIRQVEHVIASLENASDSRLFASGMAAIAAVIRSVPPHGAILVQSGIYWGATLWLRKHCAHNKVELIEADASDPEGFTTLISKEKPNLVFIEVPSNPHLRVADVSRIAQAVHGAGGVLVVDATTASPLLMKALDLGADLVLHSTTKVLNGHSDALGGVVSVRDADSNAWAFICAERHDAGAVMGPFEAYLLLRGLRTLAIRLEKMCATAQKIAEYLHAHPAIEAVLYPGLPSHAAHELAARQMTGGFGYLMSFLVHGDAKDALSVVGKLNLIQRATSLGGVESLAEHRSSLEGVSTGVQPNLIRLSVGIEHSDDLISDLEQALANHRRS